MDLFINCRKFQINAGPEKLQNVIVRDQWEFLTTLTTFSIKTSHNLIQESHSPVKLTRRSILGFFFPTK